LPGRIYTLTARLATGLRRRLNGSAWCRAAKGLSPGTPTRSPSQAQAAGRTAAHGGRSRRFRAL
jgi:hypothetical protein